MSLKPHTQKTTRQHKVKIPVCIRQHSDQVLNENCLWSKSKGYGRVLFVKENLFEKSSLFLCSSLPSPLLLRFLCLSILFAFNTSAHPPTPTPTLTQLNNVSRKHCTSIPPSICVQKKCVQMMQSPPSPLKWRLEWSPCLAVC